MIQMSKNKTYNYIFEPISSKKIEVLSETTNSDGSLKVIFKARLQTADERNQNRRIYSREVCESIVNQLKDKAKSRSLLMEVDKKDSTIK